MEKCPHCGGPGTEARRTTATVEGKLFWRITKTCDHGNSMVVWTEYDDSIRDYGNHEAVEFRQQKKADRRVAVPSKKESRHQRELRWNGEWTVNQVIDKRAMRKHARSVVKPYIPKER